MNANLFFERIRDYYRKTGVRFLNTHRSSEYLRLGLPDTRGFTPHLRTINLYREQEAEILKLQDTREAWLAHDLLHIAFYDFVSLNLGPDSWLDSARFLENHLASEAFAVILLDYQVLSQTPGRTLTVDMDQKLWREFQKLNPILPELVSYDFIELLLKLYLEGASQALQPKAPLNNEYEKWLGHELRYTEKQRYYVQLWLDDLQGKPFSNQVVSIGDSYVGEAVWELIQIFSRSSPSEWSAYTNDVKNLARKNKNFFSNFGKYKIPRDSYDFRFTEIASLSPQQLSAALDRAQSPSVSNLFLFWQIIALIDHRKLNENDKLSVSRLAQTANTTEISTSAWHSVQEICRSARESAQLRAPERLSTFFLP